jgi:hypothetical protein
MAAALLSSGEIVEIVVGDDWECGAEFGGGGTGGTVVPIDGHLAANRISLRSDLCRGDNPVSGYQVTRQNRPNIIGFAGV